MQDQGKRLLLAVALALGVMFAWQLLFPGKEPPPDQAPPDAATVEVQHQWSLAGVPSDPADAPPAVDAQDEQLLELAHPGFVATFSSHGGVLRSWKLTDKRFQRDRSRGELLPCTLVEDNTRCEPLPDAGAFGVNFWDSTFVLPERTVWTGTKVSDTEVRYTYNDERFELEKTFVLDPAAYMVRMTVTAKVKVPAGREARQTLAVAVFGAQDPKDDGGGGQSIAARVWESVTWRGEEAFHTGVNTLLAQPRFEANFQWTGFDHPYMFVSLAPRWQRPASVEKYTFARPDGLMRTDILFRPDMTFKPDSGAITREVVGYLGPKSYERLQLADESSGFPTGFNQVVDLGWFGFIGKPLLWLLLKFYAFFQNWGLAIVLLTILVKGATIPFTTKSMRSMKAMAVLAPQMKDLQAKYKEDKARLQQETMALYKQHGANPLSGCLPILLQMPIWLALYRMLSSAGELYQQPFIPGWIDDLTNSDPYHVLPVVLMVTMFLQARLTPMVATDATQRFQQRLMMYGLPLMFGVMSFFFPAGLTLYIFTNTILSALHSIYMNKFDKKSIALAEQLKKNQEKAAQAAAATKTTPSAPGKASASASAAGKAAADDGGGDDDDGGDAAKPAKPAGAPRPGGGASSRAKRKKRRR
jgi:YidC/Oxa1 family membrane protein insertase